MFRKVDGKIMSVDGKFPFRRVNSLTFEVEGEQFPDPGTSLTFTNQYLSLESLKSQTITIDYNDGSNITYPTVEDNGLHYVNIHWKENQPGYYDRHMYQDSNTGSRFITITFEYPYSITSVDFNYVKLKGNFPDGISSLNNLNTLILLGTRNLETFPVSISKNKNIISLQIDQAMHSKLAIIPDAFFEMNMATFSIGGSFNLSNNISSNFFKINQLKDTLEYLQVRSTEIIQFPQEIVELQKLRILRALGNNLTSFQSLLGELKELEELEIGSNQGVTNTSIPFLSQLYKLKRLRLQISNLNLSDMPTSFSNLWSLNTFLTFEYFVNSNPRFNEFINHFYTLITNEANITQDPNAFGGQYPYRFRNISWGSGSLSFTGAKVAPAGYVQGVSNGTPANEGEKVYVMQNQYGHVIDHA